MTRRLILVLLSAWLAGAALTARAAFDPVNDDTDIFLANPAFASTRPNVLIFVDNTANWSQSAGTGTKYDGVRAALKAVLKNTVTDAYNVGMAMFVETGNPNNSVDGAYIRYGVRQMTGTDTDLSSNKGKLIKSIDALSENGDKGNNATFSLAMAEMFNYFAGRNTYSGHGKDKADANDTVYVTGGTPARQSLAGSPLAASALPAPTGTSTATAYVSPIVDGCQKNFIIFISNGEASDNSSSLSDAATLYQSQTGTTPGTISLSPSGSEGILSDEYAKYMANSDCNPTFPGIQTVITYTIDVLPKSTGQGPAHTALLKSMATNGKGKYFAITDMSNTSQIETALTTIFQEVQSVNNVFASTTLPVSVNVRGTNLNQVYIGVFRPDATKSPRWFGNLKMYKLAVDTATQTLFLADRNGVKAEDEVSGFISTTASSFWNERNNVDFWKFRDASLNGPGGNNELPDGNLVEKGGVAQQMRANNATSQASRKVYTCTGATSSDPCAAGAALSATPFVAANSAIVAPADVGAYASVAVTALSSNAAGTATADTAAAHGLVAGNTVRIEGASPAVYNGDFTVIAPVYPSIVTRTATTLVQVLGVATMTTSVAHGFSNGDTITITGANETGYNKTATITTAGGTTFTYSVDSALASPATGTITATRLPRLTYTLPFVPPANRARATAVSSLNTGDTVIIDTSPDGYDTPVTGSSVTVINSTTFEYTSGSISGAHTGPVVTAKARKAISNLSGSGTTASATVPHHGYGAVGSTVPNITIAGANETAFNTTSPVTITITSADSFSYTTPATITGTANSAQAKVLGHTFATGGYVHIVGSSVAGYNTITGTTVGTPQTVSSTQADFFTFPSTQSTTGTGGAAGVIITGISYPGGSSNVATVTTATAHGFLTSPATTIKFFGTGGTFVSSNACTGYNNATNTQTFTVTSTPSTTSFTITAHRACPTSVPAGSIVGFDISAAAPSAGINPIVSATGTMYSERSLTISSILALTTATGSITAGNPAVADATLRDSIVNWVRGQDNKENENLDCTVSPYFPCVPVTNATPRLTDARSTFHSDVLHSRPATVNYSRFPSDPTVPANDNDVYVFYGSNGGLLHAVKGGVGTDESGVNPGDERWAFIPREFFPKMKRLRENSPLISNTTQKDYFFDGSMGVYQKDVVPAGGRAGTIGDDPGDKVHLYVSLRRGGDFIYALDVTNPAAPKLLWRKGSSDTGWAELAQTWSEPRVSRVKWAFDPTGNPDSVVLIFGAGYDDSVEDINPCLAREIRSDAVVQLAIGTGTVTYTTGGSCTITAPTGSTTDFFRKRGRGILVVDAFTGNVLWQVGADPVDAVVNLPHPDMTCSISSDISVLDRNRDGFADRLYVGDTCGNVWRAEISSTDPRDWTVTKIAAFSTGSASDVTGKRKFLFPPDIVLSKDSLGVHFAVLLGSGDREHPFDTNVQNSFFMVKDRDTSSSDQTGLENATTTSIAVPTSASTTAPTSFTDVFNATNVDGVNDFGWRIDLLPGEKNVGSAVTVSGTTFFNTNQPSSTAGGGSCGSNLGIARQYLVSYTDASATKDLNGLGSLSTANRSKIHSGGGYLPSPVPIVVEIDGKKYQVVCSGITCTSPGGLTLDARLRTYWYKEIDQ